MESGWHPHIKSDHKQDTTKNISPQIPIQRTPYISEIWKVYCTISHNTITPTTQPYTPSNTLTQSRLTIITGNNGTISTQTIIEHQPTSFANMAKNTSIKTFDL